MKSTVVFFILISIVAIPTFGFLTMKHYTGHSNCLAMLANNGQCPAKISNNPLLSASLHLNALKRLSSASFSNGITALSGLIFLYLLAFTVLLTPAGNNGILKISHAQRAGDFDLTLKSEGNFKERQLNWILFYKNTP